MGTASPAATILIVDDNPGSAKSLKLVLSAEGYETDCAATAHEALTMAGDREYEAALIDISLPDGSGIDLLPELRRLLPSLVAVIVTGHASTDSSIEALNRGASGYVRKPVDVRNLLALLRNGLERKRLEEENRLMLRRLSLLHAVGATVSAGLEPAETLAETLSLVVSLLDLQAGAIWWTGAADQELRLAAAVGLPEEVLGRLTAGVCRLAADGGDAEQPRGCSALDLGLEGEEADDGWTFRVVALRGHTEPVAWMAVGGRRGGSDGSEDQGFLGAVAGQLGVAMDNMRLYDDLRAAYDQLKETQAQVVKSEKLSALSRVISGVAHELNNPLTAILGYCEVLGREDVSERAATAVGRVSSQARRCAGIVKELVAFAKPAEMALEPVDVQEVLDCALRAAEDHRGEKIEISRQLGEPVPQTAGDPQALEQALANVIVNAYQAMEDGDGTLTIETTTDDGEIVVVVGDTGPGMPADVLPRVFDPFFTTKGVNQGAGLGLSVSHGIVREHGGDLTADNGPQGGAVLRMRLPIRQPRSEADPEPARDADFAMDYAPWLQ